MASRRKRAFIARLRSQAGAELSLPTRLHHFSMPGLMSMDGDEFGAREHLFVLSVDATSLSPDGWSPRRAEQNLEKDSPAMPDDRFEIARFSLVTYPAALVEALGWDSICFGSEENYFHDLIEHLDRRVPGLMDNGLIYAKRLDVHPIARGQSLGIRLIRAGLDRVARAESEIDVVMLIARPESSMYEPEKHDAWRAAGPQSEDQNDPSWDEEIAESHRLASYYQRLGFKRWTKRLERTPMQVLYTTGVEYLQGPGTPAKKRRQGR